jgi:hypothetical protein
LLNSGRNGDGNTICLPQSIGIVDHTHDLIHEFTHRDITLRAVVASEPCFVGYATTPRVAFEEPISDQAFTMDVSTIWGTHPHALFSLTRYPNFSRE